MDKNSVLKGSLIKHIIRLSIPSVIGMLSFVIFNFTDTYFLSQLGTDALAAMGFTFPIIMIVGAISSGMSMGAASMVSRAMGEKNQKKMQEIATNGILLSLLFVAIISVVGLLTMDPLFKALGAEGNVLVLVKQYMQIWYMFVVVVVMPPVSDSAMRAKGDMIRPLVVMIVCSLFNVILDPIFIFGFAGIPALGIRGAIIATVISRTLGMVATVYFSAVHHRLLSFQAIHIDTIKRVWGNILKIGVPNMLMLLMPQLIRTLLTTLVSNVGGNTAVAAIAVGTKVESLVNVITAGFGLALIPIIGQNFGAGKFERVEETRKLALRFATFYGLGMFAMFIPAAKPLAFIFSDVPEVIDYSVQYLWIMVFGMIGLNIMNWMSQAFTTVGKPRYTMIINVVGTLTVTIPLMYMGYFCIGYIGILLGVMTSQLILGFIAMKLSRTKLLI